MSDAHRKVEVIDGGSGGGGGATAEKQDEQTTFLEAIADALAAALPTSLGGAGGLKVQQVAATPAGSNTIGKIDQGEGGSPGSPWYVNLVDGLGVALDVATDTVLQALLARFPVAALLGDTNDPQLVTQFGALGLVFDPNSGPSGRWRRLLGDSSGRPIVSNSPRTPSNEFRTNGTYVEQDAASGGFALHVSVVWADADGWVQFHDKSGAVINTDVPVLSYPIRAGATIVVARPGGGVLYNFSTKLRIVFSSTQYAATLGGAHIGHLTKGE